MADPDPRPACPNDPDPRPAFPTIGAGHSPDSMWVAHAHNDSQIGASLTRRECAILAHLLYWGGAVVAAAVIIVTVVLYLFADMLGSFSPDIAVQCRAAATGSSLNSPFPQALPAHR